MANRPLQTTVSQECIDELLAFVTRHIEPDETPGEAVHSGYDWFHEYFSFRPDVELLSQLAQAYYQSRYVHKLLVALKLDGRERFPFLLLQLLEYASLYEALTDYLIKEKYFDSEDFLGKRKKRKSGSGRSLILQRPCYFIIRMERRSGYFSRTRKRSCLSFVILGFQIG